MRIDVHAHLVPAELSTLARSFDGPRWPLLEGDGDDRTIVVAGAAYRRADPTYWSVPARVARLDGCGIDLQVLSPLPVLIPHWAGPIDAARWCRAVNETIARAVADGAGRFVGFGILPVQDPVRAADVWSEASALGLVGVELGTAVDAQRLLHDAQVDELLAHLAEQDVPVLVHPTRTDALGALSADLERGLALPTDTALAVAPRLERAGDAPHPRACLSHAGGTLLWEWSRVFSPRARGGRDVPPWLYVDTAGCRVEHVRFVLDVLGPDRVMLGTDQPAVDDLTVAALLESCDAAWYEAVTSGTAARFLGLDLGR